MTSKRLMAPWGALIDRSKQVSFRFNGQEFSGFAGDTLASALLANDVRIVGRSFKLHRPRGIMSCGPEEPSALFDVDDGTRSFPNVRATLLQLRDGISVRSVNCWPSARFDIGSVQQLLSPFLPAGFYYKTFKWPNWHLYEPSIRRRAGLGRICNKPDLDRYDEVSAQADVVVVGGGPAGLSAAAAAAAAGARVFLIVSHRKVGQTLIWQAPEIDESLLLEQLKRAGVTTLMNSFAFGVYDHNLVCAREDLRTLRPMESASERLWKIRARTIVLACGAIERPMLFPDNDRPGVMFADAARKYIHAYGIASGTRATIVTNSDSAYQLPSIFRRVGIEIAAILDRRPPEGRGQAAKSAYADIIHRSSISRVLGGRSVRGCEVASPLLSSRLRLDCDLLLSAGGWTPSVHLYSQAGGKLKWDHDSSMFVPDANLPSIVSVGACAGIFDLARALQHADACGRALARGEPPPTATPSGAGISLANTLAKTRTRTKQFVDLQNDVLSTDVELAIRENYRSVEHLKRYTTAGMGTDQGKTSNVNALVLLGGATNRAPSEVGTTKFRPPFTPITLGALVGYRRGDLIRPRRFMTAHTWHTERGAAFEEYGGWMRPAAYPRNEESIESAARREVLTTRTAAGVFDGSPLGKLEVFGADAARFLDFMYANSISSLELGRARYGLVLNEHGIIADDGIVARLAADLFWVNTSSGGAERTAAAFEEWAQCEFPHWKVLITPMTSRWCNITVAGPRAWEWLRLVGFPELLAPANMKHMTMQEALWEGRQVRVLRASFCGELSYEVNIPARLATPLLSRLWTAKDAVGGCAYGIEALQVMRIEKGYIHIGSDTDGTTVPADLGYGAIVDRKLGDFVGRRSLSRENALDNNRLQLVGLATADANTLIPVGAHIAKSSPPTIAEGHVTSSVISPSLNRSVTLAMLKAGRSRIGEVVELFHGRSHFKARVVSPCFYDADGARLNG